MGTGYGLDKDNAAGVTIDPELEAEGEAQNAGGIPRGHGANSKAVSATAEPPMPLTPDQLPSTISTWSMYELIRVIFVLKPSGSVADEGGGQRLHKLTTDE
jgi:hypothetical protein